MEQRERSAAAFPLMIALYPFIVGAGSLYLPARHLALLVLALLALRLLQPAKGPRLNRWMPLLQLAPAAVVLAALVLNSGLPLLLLPAMINAALFVLFILTVCYPPSVAERFARVHVANISPEQLAYCRTVTLLWCCFFAANGAISLYTVFYTPVAVWSVYNGAVAYVLLALMFAGEACYRYWRFRVYAGSALDPIFIRIFPPHEERRP